MKRLFITIGLVTILVPVSVHANALAFDAGMKNTSSNTQKILTKGTL